MRDFNTPRTVVPREVSAAFDAIRLALREMDIPVLNSLREVRAIANGTSAYFLDGNTLYRYSKIGNKLFKEMVADGVDEEAVKELADEQIAAAPRAGDVYNTITTSAVENEEKVEIRSYRNTNPPLENFYINFYRNIDDYVQNMQLASEDRPTDISFTPATPEQDEEEHDVVIRYTPVNNEDFLHRFGLR